MTYRDQTTEPATPVRRKRVLLSVLAALVLVLLGVAVGYLLLPAVLPMEGHTHEDAADLYTCPMHPQVVQEGPGTCPICFMDLVPMNGAEEQGDEHGDDMVHVTPRNRVIAGVQTVEIDYAALADDITAPAVVEYNEQAHRVVSARYGGRIERLYVDKTGQTVRRGQPLLDIYSPELVAAQKEYLIALDTRNVETAGRGDRLVGAARTKLELLGMSDAQINALEQRGEIAYTVTVFSPVSGVVTSRAATEGAYVNEGSPLLEIVDLSSVWVVANVYESDIHRIRQGMAMAVSGPGIGGDVRRGTVEYIYPTVDPQSRTVQVRGVFANPQGALKPGMYLTATLEAPVERSLAVPVNAVIRTGRRNLVYVEVEENMFEPREVTLGVRNDGYYQIAEGALRAGDRVVAEGGYLLDSERQLTSPAAADPHAGHSTGGSND